VIHANGPKNHKTTIEFTGKAPQKNEVALKSTSLQAMPGYGTMIDQIRASLPANLHGIDVQIHIAIFMKNNMTALFQAGVAGALFCQAI